MAKVFLGLGSNLGEKQKILSSALIEIENRIGDILQTSSIFETEPWGFECDNNFLNMVISVETDFSPYEILNHIQIIEKKFLRKRTTVGYQARTLDIDILFYGDDIYHSDDLQIPHVHAHKRKFVLLPMKEIAPEYKHPLLNQTIYNLTENCIDKTEITIL